MLKIKNMVIVMKNAFDGFVSRLDTAEDIPIKTSKIEKPREQRLKNKKTKSHNRIFKDCGIPTKSVTYA